MQWCLTKSSKFSETQSPFVKMSGFSKSKRSIVAKFQTMSKHFHVVILVFILSVSDIYTYSLKIGKFVVLKCKKLESVKLWFLVLGFLLPIDHDRLTIKKTVQNSMNRFQASRIAITNPKNSSFHPVFADVSNQDVYLTMKSGNLKLFPYH